MGTEYTEYTPFWNAIVEKRSMIMKMEILEALDMGYVNLCNIACLILGMPLNFLLLVFLLDRISILDNPNGRSCYSVWGRDGRHQQEHEGRRPHGPHPQTFTHCTMITNRGIMIPLFIESGSRIAKSLKIQLSDQDPVPES